MDNFALRTLLRKIDAKAQAGMCRFWREDIRAALREIRDLVAVPLTGKVVVITAQKMREEFEAALANKPEARLWNTTDAMLWAFVRGHEVAREVSTSAPDMTDEQIKEICRKGGWDDSFQSLRFARAVLAAQRGLP